MYKLQINENGILSFDGSFRTTFIRDFDNFFHFQSLIAPLWTDLDIQSGGRILFRVTTDINTLERASNLTQQQFPGVDFEPTNVIIVTWFEVGHRFLDNVCYSLRYVCDCERYHNHFLSKT